MRRWYARQSGTVRRSFRDRTIMARRERYVIGQLTAERIVHGFECGEHDLDRFLSVHALKNQERGLGSTYVASVGEDKRAAGFFTLSYGQLSVALLPEAERKGLPGYPAPIIRLARLGVDQRFQGLGLGGMLLVEAIRRSVAAAEDLGAYAIEVKAKNDSAAKFYEHYGFQPLDDDPLHLYLPMSAARAV